MDFLLFFTGDFAPNIIEKKKIFKTQNVQECTRQNIANRERTLSVNYEIIKNCVTVSHSLEKWKMKACNQYLKKIYLLK